MAGWRIPVLPLASPYTPHYAKPYTPLQVAHLFSYLLVHTRIDQDACRGIGIDGRRRVGQASMGDANRDAARSRGDAGSAPQLEAVERVAAAGSGGSLACQRKPESTCSSRCDAGVAAGAGPGPGPGPCSSLPPRQRRGQVTGGAFSSVTEDAGARSRKKSYLLKPGGGAVESSSKDRPRRHSREARALQH